METRRKKQTQRKKNLFTMTSGDFVIVVRNNSIIDSKYTFRHNYVVEWPLFDDCIFQIGLNFANLKCQVVEMCAQVETNITYQLACQICKIEVIDIILCSMPVQTSRCFRNLCTILFAPSFFLNFFEIFFFRRVFWQNILKN